LPCFNLGTAAQDSSSSEIVNLEGHCNSETDPYNRSGVVGYLGYGMLDYLRTIGIRTEATSQKCASLQSCNRSLIGLSDTSDRSLCEFRIWCQCLSVHHERRATSAVLFAHARTGHNAGADHINPDRRRFHHGSRY
jgi:hypothetical protein